MAKISVVIPKTFEGSTNIDVSHANSYYDLLNFVKAYASHNTQAIKMICAGKTLNCNTPLAQQGLKDNSKVLVMLTTRDIGSSSDNNHDNSSTVVEKASAAAEKLAKSTNRRADIEDAFGNSVTLADDDRTSLMVGLTLHEKGKKCYRNNDLNNALKFMLEAERSFLKASKSVLDSVDNFGFLCLDIVWIHLLLSNHDALSEAKTRIDTCSRTFERVYGAAKERLTYYNSGMVPEINMIHYARLNLLRAIVAHHQNHAGRAKEFLAIAEMEIAALRVSDQEIVSLLQLLGGLASDGDDDLSDAATRECVRALRVCKHDVGNAFDFVTQERMKRLEIKRKRQERAEAERLESQAQRLLQMQKKQRLMEEQRQLQLAIALSRQQPSGTDGTDGVAGGKGKASDDADSAAALAAAMVAGDDSGVNNNTTTTNENNINDDDDGDGENDEDEITELISDLSNKEIRESGCFDVQLTLEEAFLKKYTELINRS